MPSKLQFRRWCVLPPNDGPILDVARSFVVNWVLRKGKSSGSPTPKVVASIPDRSHPWGVLHRKGHVASIVFLGNG
jgi:hypothetical protein